MAGRWPEIGPPSTIPTGWEVVPRLQGWRFRIEPIPAGLRLRS